jgi:hypothetical protein
MQPVLSLLTMSHKMIQLAGWGVCTFLTWKTCWYFCLGKALQVLYP